MDTRYIPEDYAERRRLRRLIQTFVQEKAPVPPVPLEQLRELAVQFLERMQLDRTMLDWTMVEIHNQAWMPIVSAIPYDRRLLLLPKCLSNARRCEGEMDEMGLLCHGCGRCVIPDLQAWADRHGVLSLVAEGFTSVISLIQNHVVDAVIGVSCLDSLEKAFPLLINHAVPGIAVPLNDGGCTDTHVDVDYVRQLLPLHSEPEQVPIRFDYIQQQVVEWFTPDSLSQLLTPATDVTSKASLHWMSSGGKRWRPFLLAAVYAAMTGETSMPTQVKLAAVAVECFHKASLIHDDIQDHDTERNGKPTVCALYGDALAINIGDHLLGDGYRLLTLTNNIGLLRLAAEAHIALCRGQGEELAWKPHHPTTLAWVLDIFRHKTVPAFEVALRMGLHCANVEGELHQVLHQYSEALGIAYQLRDDLEDIHTEQTAKPSAPYALQCNNPDATPQALAAMLANLAEDYHTQALAALGGVKVAGLKRLLFQVTEKIFNPTPHATSPDPPDPAHP